MNPLYCFKLDTETGEIEKRVITSYTSKKFNDNKEFYSYQRRGNVYHCYVKDLDRFKNDHVYSFEDNYEKAKASILKALDVKRLKAHNDYLKYTQVKNKIEGWGY